MDLPVDFRVLLTGTPLQNNLQELVVRPATPLPTPSKRIKLTSRASAPAGPQSILNFILPDYFKDAEDSLRAIFKVSSDSHASLLSRQRVSRAQKMMKPFVLRRRKDQVRPPFSPRQPLSSAIADQQHSPLSLLPPCRSSKTCPRRTCLSSTAR